MPAGYSARSRPFWSKTATGITTTPVAVAIPEGATKLVLIPTVRSFVCVGNSYTAPAVAGVDGVITLATWGTPTGGTFTLTAFDNQRNEVSTSAIPYNETAANIKTALVATGVFASGDITAAGGALPTAVTLTFTGIYAKTVPNLTVTANALTGGTNPSATTRVTTAPLGNGGYGYAETSGMTIILDQDKRTTNDRFLYIASVTSTIDYFLTAYA